MAGLVPAIHVLRLCQRCGCPAQARARAGEAGPGWPGM